MGQAGGEFLSVMAHCAEHTGVYAGYLFGLITGRRLRPAYSSHSTSLGVLPRSPRRILAPLSLLARILRRSRNTPVRCGVRIVAVIISTTARRAGGDVFRGSKADRREP